MGKWRRNDSVEINAGNNVHSTSGQMLAKKRIDVSGEAVMFDTAHNIGNSQRHSSDLKVGKQGAIGTAWLWQSVAETGHL